MIFQTICRLFILEKSVIDTERCAHPLTRISCKKSARTDSPPALAENPIDMEKFKFSLDSLRNCVWPWKPIIFSFLFIYSLFFCFQFHFDLSSTVAKSRPHHTDFKYSRFSAWSSSLFFFTTLQKKFNFCFTERNSCCFACCRFNNSNIVVVGLKTQSNAMLLSKIRSMLAEANVLRCSAQLA